MCNLCIEVSILKKLIFNCVVKFSLYILCLDYVIKIIFLKFFVCFFFVRLDNLYYFFKCLKEIYFILINILILLMLSGFIFVLFY